MTELLELAKKREHDKQRRYTTLLLQTAKSAEPDPASILDALDGLGIDPERFQTDLDTHRQREDWRSQIANEAGLRKRLSESEAEHLAELERFKLIADQHTKKCLDLHASKEAIRSELASIEECKRLLQTQESPVAPHLRAEIIEVEKRIHQLSTALAELRSRAHRGNPLAGVENVDELIERGEAALEEVQRQADELREALSRQ